MDVNIDNKNDPVESSRSYISDAFKYIYNLVFGSSDKEGASVSMETPQEQDNIVSEQQPESVQCSNGVNMFTLGSSSCDTKQNTLLCDISIKINSKHKPLKLQVPKKLVRIDNGKSIYFDDKEGMVYFECLKINEYKVADYAASNNINLSITQYYKDDSNDASGNCIIICLMATLPNNIVDELNNNDDKKGDIRCESYIYVSYNVDKQISYIEKDDGFSSSLNIKLYNNWTDLNEEHPNIIPNPNPLERTRTSRSSYNYLFDLDKFKRDKLNEELHPQQSTSQQQPKKTVSPLWSKKSPVSEYKEGIQLSTIMYDLMTHQPSGLDEVALSRFPQDQSNNIQGLNTEKLFTPIKTQLRNEKIDKDTLSKLSKYTFAVNDFVDLAHDVRTLPHLDSYISLVFPDESQKTQKTQISTALQELFTTKGNINVIKSHTIQIENIKNLIAKLTKIGVVIPNIQLDSKYASRYDMFLQFIVDLIRNVNRCNYSESGKQIIIKTFKDFFKKMDSNEQLKFCQDVQNSIDNFNTGDSNKSVNVGVDISAALSNKSEHYPSILKKCGLDGCQNGEEEESNDKKSYIITNIYGLYDFKIEGSNKAGWTINIYKHGDTKPALLTWEEISKDFRIILDDVIWYVETNIYKTNITTIYRNKKYDNADHTARDKEYAKIRFDGSLKVDEKSLLVYSLKTAMDKLYLTSKKELTELGTIDSYVYGDVFIRYLLGELDNFLMIYRASDDSGEPSNNECVIESSDSLGRGFMVYPRVQNVFTDDAGEKLMKKILVYASFLENLASMCCPKNDSFETQDSQAHSGEALSPNIFGLTLVGGNLFSNTSNTLGSLIPRNIQMSYRLENFVDRLTTYDDGLLDSIENKTEYEKLLLCWYLEERKIVIDKVKLYVKVLKELMKMNMTTDDGKKKIREEIAKLPSLEEILTMSTPSFYIENEDTLIIPETNIESVGFSDGKIEIQISGTSLKEDVKDTEGEYKVKNDDKVVGPIVLELLYNLANRVNADEEKSKINQQINDIKNTYELSVFGKSSNYCASGLFSESTGNGDGNAEGDPAPKRQRLGWSSNISERSEPNQQPTTSIWNIFGSSGGAGSRERNNPTRKRKPRKIPRRTIRRRHDGNKRTKKRRPRKHPRRTIRRGHHNKKGTQKRRK